MPSRSTNAARDIQDPNKDEDEMEYQTSKELKDCRSNENAQDILKYSFVKQLKRSSQIMTGHDNHCLEKKKDQLSKEAAEPSEEARSHWTPVKTVDTPEGSGLKNSTFCQSS